MTNNIRVERAIKRMTQQQLAELVKQSMPLNKGNMFHPLYWH